MGNPTPDHQSHDQNEADHAPLATVSWNGAIAAWSWARMKLCVVVWMAMPEPQPIMMA